MPNTDTSNVAHIEQAKLPDNAEMIRLGVEAEEFLSSNIGRYILKRAMDEAIDATNKIRQLKSSEPDFKQKYDELQQIIERQTDLNRWIKEATNIGRQAYEQYQQEFSEEQS